ncbi:hypothetical protein HOLDEFILI_04127 [Holdemania filiformis DSM 12042]|uniref:Uncharacterized protein n=1 Tax=Holdemania filiformis DSM 12042 TaxID=545696 RepID=B9YE53_9FIRM|nr:hypothetical protein HOLDEFILI_04127 [Holdemania filiformis DSM 12042]
MFYFVKNCGTDKLDVVSEPMHSLSTRQPFSCLGIAVPLILR